MEHAAAAKARPIEDQAKGQLGATSLDALAYCGTWIRLGIALKCGPLHSGTNYSTSPFATLPHSGAAIRPIISGVS